MANIVKYEVPSLQVLTSAAIVTRCWKKEGGQKLIIDLFHAKAMKHQVDTANDEETPQLPAYNTFVDKAIVNIFNITSLPRAIKMNLANMFLDYQQEIYKFSKFIFSAFSSTNSSYLNSSMQSIVVNPDGTINKKKSILEILTIAVFFTTIKVRLTSYYCISVSEICNYLSHTKIILRQFKSRYCLRQHFANPQTYWENGVRNESIFEHCASRGPVESLEYFLHTLPARSMQKHLARAAVLALHCNVDIVRKIMFFYKYMNRAPWEKFLRRNFLEIFKAFSKSYRHSHMCIIFFKQNLPRMTPSLLQEIFRFFSNDLMKNYQSSNEIYKEINLYKFGELFLSVWEMTPLKSKYSMMSEMFKVINMFLHFNYFNVIVSIIDRTDLQCHEDLAKTIDYAMMRIIITDKLEKLEYFLSIINIKFDSSYIKKNFVTYENFKMLIELDECKHIQSYDILLRLSFDSVEEIHDLKIKLLSDKLFVNTSVDSIRTGNLTLDNFYLLIKWCYSDNLTLTHNYVKTKKNLLRKIYKNYTLFTNKTIRSTNPFNLTEEEYHDIAQYIKKEIKYLHEFSLSVVKQRNFKELHVMFNNVFDTKTEIEEYLLCFFKSPEGREAVRSMISEADNIYDVKLFYRLNAETTWISYFLDFRQYFILNNEIREVLLSFINDRQSADFVKDVSPIDMQNYESRHSYLAICEDNWELLRVLIESSGFIYRGDSDSSDSSI